MGSSDFLHPLNLCMCLLKHDIYFMFFGFCYLWVCKGLKYHRKNFKQLDFCWLWNSSLSLNSWDVPIFLEANPLLYWSFHTIGIFVIHFKRSIGKYWTSADCGLNGFICRAVVNNITTFPWIYQHDFQVLVSWKSRIIRLGLQFSADTWSS